MTSNGNADSTIQSTSKELTYLSKHTNLNNPEEVKQFIANKNVSNGTKRIYCTAYNRYCQYYKIKWEKPIYQLKQQMIKLPTTQDLEKIIAKAPPLLSIKLTLSKETGLRPIELMTLKVKDIDLDKKLIYPTTAKRGNPRILKISNKLQERLQNHVHRRKLKENDTLFKGTALTYGNHFREVRNRLAEKLHEPSLKTIRLYDLRHYFATMLYDKTRDILYVRQQLGHKKLETTLTYTQLLNINEEEEYTCKTATTIKQATKLIENGFQYITEINGTKLFRKHK